MPYLNTDHTIGTEFLLERQDYRCSQHLGVLLGEWRGVPKEVSADVAPRIEQHDVNGYPHGVRPDEHVEVDGRVECRATIPGCKIDVGLEAGPD